jgi:hypothetical protein
MAAAGSEEKKVFFDISIGGAPAGRIVFEVRGPWKFRAPRAARRGAAPTARR